MKNHSVAEVGDLGSMVEKSATKGQGSMSGVKTAEAAKVPFKNDNGANPPAEIRPNRRKRRQTYSSSARSGMRRTDSTLTIQRYA